MTSKQEVLSYVLATAAEGGINYWANERHNGRTQVIRLERDDNGDYTSIVFDRIAVEQLAGAALSPFVTVLNEEGTEVAVDFKALGRAFRAILGGKVTFGREPLGPNSQLRKVASALLFCKSNDDAPDYDAGDADNLVQAALFGDVIYG